MKKDGCIFCMLANGDIPANSPYEDDLVKVIFDRGPATKGHALILPKNHCEDIYEIDEETAARITVVASRVAKAMKAAFNVDGLNVLQNNGEVAGQTVFHYHTHLIPRYKGDGVTLEWTPGEVTDADVDSMVEAVKNNM